MNTYLVVKRHTNIHNGSNATHLTLSVSEGTRATSMQSFGSVTLFIQPMNSHAISEQYTQETVNNHVL